MHKVRVSLAWVALSTVVLYVMLIAAAGVFAR
jgi:hypothetical protein